MVYGPVKGVKHSSCGILAEFARGEVSWYSFTAPKGILYALRQKLYDKMMIIKPRKRKPCQSLPDPRYGHSLVDAHIFDDNGDAKTSESVDQLLALATETKMSVLLPYSVKAEIEHPKTPQSVKHRASCLIYTMPVTLTPNEESTHRLVRALMRGNATSGKHDADAFHLVEASKYGRFFVSLDNRVLKKKLEIQCLLPGLWIVTPIELIKLYHDYVAQFQA